MKPNIVSSILILLSLLANELLAVGPGLTFSDGVFDDSDWTFTSITNDGSDGFAQSAQVSAGGDPNEYREVTNVMIVGSVDTGSNVIGLHIFNTAVYSPTLQGGILSIDFDIDFNNLNVTDNGQAYGLALVQDSEVFVAQLPERTNTPPTSPSEWQGKPATTFIADDFFRVETSLFNLRDDSAEPDFSPSASPVTLGFFTRNSLPPGQGPGTSSTMLVGYDNWEVTINPIPEPTAFVLATAAFCLAIRHRI